MKPVNTLLPEIMTGTAVQELLGISRTTLFRMEKKGEIPVYRFAGKKYYRRSELFAAITANRVEINPAESTQAA